MTEKKKSTTNAKVLTVLLIILFVGSCACLIFAGVTGRIHKPSDSDTDATTTAAVEENTTYSNTTVSADATALTTAEATEATEATEMQSVALILHDTYYACSAVDANGDDVSLNAYFGSGFAAYGGAITFNSGRFSIDMGVSAGGSANVGDYRFVSDTELELRYDNSDISTAAVEISKGEVVSIDVAMDDITVTFKAQ